MFHAVRTYSENTNSVEFSGFRTPLSIRFDQWTGTPKLSIDSRVLLGCSLSGMALMPSYPNDQSHRIDDVINLHEPIELKFAARLHLVTEAACSKREQW
jgi:hypothetical protein